MRSGPTHVGRFALAVGVELGLGDDDLALLHAAGSTTGDFDPQRPGPAGEWRELPAAARVMQVVDAYLDLVREREERSGASPLYALSCLQRLAPSHFDPQVVTAFARLLDVRAAAGRPRSAAGS